jgi:hypothetical protein
MSERAGRVAEELVERSGGFLYADERELAKKIAVAAYLVGITDTLEIFQVLVGYTEDGQDAIMRKAAIELGVTRSSAENEDRGYGEEV